MKFGKELASQMVQEWGEAYMDYNFLKGVLKDISRFRRRNAAAQSSVPAAAATRKNSLKRRLSMYRAFSGLTNRLSSPRGTPRSNHEDEEVILVNAVEQEGIGAPQYQTMFLMSSEAGGEYELVFFRRLDDEFNKVVRFYREKVEEVRKEADELSKQMDALIALRIVVEKPPVDINGAQSQRRTDSAVIEAKSHMDAIQEIEMSGEEVAEDGETSAGTATMADQNTKIEEEKTNNFTDFRPAPLHVLYDVRVNIQPETPISTLKNILMASNSELKYNRAELRKAEERLRKAFMEFYRKLRLLKSYCFLNTLAFSKIMKKYDKITSRKASRSYLEMVDKSYLGSSDEVSRLMERTEATFIKHFANGNRRKGMSVLRPHVKREKHRITFFHGLFSGCSIALVVAIIVSIRARHLLQHEGSDQFMENIFPLYSLFGFIVLHMLMYAGNVYFWRRYRINYPFIFGFKQGTELGYREVLLLASGISVLALAAVLWHLDMEMDPVTRSYKVLTESVPWILISVLLTITFCPLNIVYRSSRFFLIRCAWHCICAPLFKVTLPDFFLADQLTSQVQAIRSFEFYICYYGWGNFRQRSNTCQDSDVYKIFYIIVAAIPFVVRLLQCLRRLFEEKDNSQGLNGIKYFTTVAALVLRTLYEQKKGTALRVLAAAFSGITTIANTYWDIVRDWGLLERNSKNPWLRDKLLVPNKAVYFAAIVVNIILRLLWMQLILGFNLPFLHRKATAAIVACLEIIRRGIWNFFRLVYSHIGQQNSMNM
ncbi:PREDICTED: phosphate transporter PHO1 homolog 3-like isoform X2 [Ipomoea nil]|uniref:phosphate transporter PHO1 homolog 3-like isoform X2 n=1 Tax=Ipomoea nil TaxID=35883 RepID=UPI000900C210|nr:PREDICTED: phosphate transporter PHO1 homolog 3-like isoform X2 [Ipomoea nil]